MARTLSESRCTHFKNYCRRTHRASRYLGSVRSIHLELPVGSANLGFAFDSPRLRQYVARENRESPAFPSRNTPARSLLPWSFDGTPALRGREHCLLLGSGHK